MLARHARLLPLVLLLAATGCSAKPKARQPRVPVAVARAEQRTMPFALVATGTVEAIQHRGGRLAGGRRDHARAASARATRWRRARCCSSSIRARSRTRSRRRTPTLARDRAQAKLTQARRRPRGVAGRARRDLAVGVRPEARRRRRGPGLGGERRGAGARGAALARLRLDPRADRRAAPGGCSSTRATTSSRRARDALVTINQTSPVRVAFTVPGRPRAARSSATAPRTRACR